MSKDEFKRKLKKKKAKKRNKVESLDTKRIEKNLDSLENVGLLNYELDGEMAKVHLNAKAVVDFLYSLPDIPFPIENYKELKSKMRPSMDFKTTLSLMLTVSMKEYENVDFDITKMRGMAHMDEEEMVYRAQLIEEFYDLGNPEILGNYYIFKVDTNHIEAWEERAKNQRNEDFPRYFLK